MTALSVSELQALVERVFAPQSNERRIALLCDLPDETVVDRPAWKERREMALQWRDRLRETERFEAE